MKMFLKSMVYIILSVSLANTFDVTGQHFIAILYFSLLGFAAYEWLKQLNEEVSSHE